MPIYIVEYTGVLIKAELNHSYFYGCCGNVEEVSKLTDSQFHDRRIAVRRGKCAGQGVENFVQFGTTRFFRDEDPWRDGICLPFHPG